MRNCTANRNDLTRGDRHVYQNCNETYYPPTFEEESLNDEVALVLQYDIGQCPSTWHALSDRHSPIVPSSHVSHKLTQKDKQHQFNEYKRKLKLKRKCNFNSRLSELDQNHPDVFNDSNHYAFRYYSETTSNGRPSCFYTQDQRYNYGPSDQTHNMEQRALNLRYQSCSHYVNNVKLQLHYLNYGVDYLNGGCSAPRLQYDLPPSPPISPELLQVKKTRVQDMITSNTCNRILLSDSPNIDNMEPLIKQERISPLGKQQKTLNCLGAPAFPQYVPLPIHSHANIKMSMFYNNNQCINASGYPNNRLVSPKDDFIDNVNNHTRSSLPIGHCSDNSFDSFTSREHVSKHCQKVGQSCAIADDCCSHRNSVVKYDIEASIHMKIVEVDDKSSELRQDINLPAIGSFLEYLNGNESSNNGT